MKTYEIKPHVGVGPIYLGMSRAAVQSALGPPEHVAGARHAYLQGLFVDFAGDGRVEFIELANSPQFSVRFEGVCLHDARAEDAVAHVARFAALELNGSEPGYSYIFPELALSLWRGTQPEAEQDENDPDGRRFEAVGIGARGYFQSRA